MISFEKQAYSDEQIFKELNPLVSNWFKQKFSSFSPPQTYAILNIKNKVNTLVTAPTGSGKTLSAFTSILSELITLEENNKLEDKVYCLYISPLRALSNDIKRNLEEPLAEMEQIRKSKINVRVSVRTGDTTATERAKMTQKPPHILITTPESIGIILNSVKFREKLRDIQWVIVDEIHSMAENKRGTHLAISLERLQNLAGPYTRIGLSATVAPADEIANFLVGFDPDGKTRDCKVVDVQFLKKLDLKVLSPVENIIESTNQELQNQMYHLIDKLVQDHNTTLIFTNTRSATERVVHHLKTMFPKNYITEAGEELIGAHHSSLSREHRMVLEKRLQEGKMKVVVCSTSLELGIDIGEIDLVILLGSPKSITRGLQRVGRSGHRLKDLIKGRFIVTDRDDLVECTLILKNGLEHHIDKVHMPRNCLDVLAQHIFGMAIEEPQHIEVIYSTIRRSYPFKNLDRKDFDSVIKYLAGKYAGLENRRVYAKIWFDTESGMIGKRGKMARVLYMTNIGTIPDESYITVKSGDYVVGHIDEDFLERLRKGDIFVLGGNTYRYNFARGMTVQVTPTPNKLPTVPSWFSEMLPLSFDLAISIQKFRRLMDEKFTTKKTKLDIINFINEYLYVDKNSANSLYEYFREQYKFSKIPHEKRLVIEHLKLDGKNHSVVHSCYGRRTNDALSRAVAYSISRVKGRNVAITLTDTGFVLTYDGDRSWVKEAIQSLNVENLKPIVEKAIEKTEVLRRRFRHCAGRSLMILRSYKGRTKTVGRQQISAQILLNAAREIGEDFPILKEAKREVLEDFMDLKHTEEIIGMISTKSLDIEEVHLDLPSPFGLNMIARGYSDIVKIEDKLDFIRRIHQQIMKEIAEK